MYRETDKKPNPTTPASSSPQQNSPLLGLEGHSILGHGALPRPRSGSDGANIDRQRERQLVGSLTNSYKFKGNGLVKKVGPNQRIALTLDHVGDREWFCSAHDFVLFGRGCAPWKAAQSLYRARTRRLGDIPGISAQAKLSIPAHDRGWTGWNTEVSWRARGTDQSHLANATVRVRRVRDATTYTYRSQAAILHGAHADSLSCVGTFVHRALFRVVGVFRSHSNAPYCEAKFKFFPPFPAWLVETL